MKVRVCFHDKCFDGASSAAIFSRFYRECIDPKADFYYTGMTHKASHPFEDNTFDGDENAIVDFKYSSSPKLTWWFDHHQSAFLTPADAENFRERSFGKEVLRSDLQILHQVSSHDCVGEIRFRCAADRRTDPLGRHY